MPSLVPAILQEATKRTRDSVMEYLERLMLKIYKFTTALDRALITWDIIPFGIFSKENVKWAIEMLAASRQQEVYVRLLRAR